MYIPNLIHLNECIFIYHEGSRIDNITNNHKHALEGLDTFKNKNTFRKQMKSDFV